MLDLKVLKNSYIFFRLQKRKYSSDIIEGGNYNKKDELVWVPILAPLVNKKEGDKFALELKDVLIEKVE